MAQLDDDTINALGDIDSDEEENLRKEATGLTKKKLKLQFK